uniref:30S ribosomal protein S11, chloroplastic n=1 Tax=Solanum lycopersicum TaxID=4081 RepID=A0A3Q7J7M0_SOLLC
MLYRILGRVGMDVLVHARVHVEYQRELFMFKQNFNNTIVIVIDVRGQVVSWSSAGALGFKGTRRGTPFASQTVAANTIRTIVDQGMQRAEFIIKGPRLKIDATL